MTDVTRILFAIEQGDPTAAEQFLPLVYDELRKPAAKTLANQRPGRSMQMMALTHETYTRPPDAARVPLPEQPRPLFSRRGDVRQIASPTERLAYRKPMLNH